MAKEAWQRWGAEDEKGALNLIGSSEVLQATSLVRRGMALSLAQPISEAMLVPPHRPCVSHTMIRHGGTYAGRKARPGQFQFAEDTITVPLHVGTHIDCLCHAWYDDQLYNGYAGESVTTGGATRCGAEKIGPIVTRGVLLDFVAVTGAALADGQPIGLDLLRKACARTGTEPGSGDAVLLRTGWHEAHAATGIADFNSEPGLDIDAALLLAEAGVAVVGADNYAIEVLPFAEGTIFPVHKRLIRDYGVHLIEGLVLDALAATGVHEFLFVAAALPVVGGTGSPLAPVAVL